MRTLRLLLLILGFSIVGSATAGDRPDLAWLAGAWCSSNADQSIEEHWLAERGGLMLGVNRTVSPRRTTFEFLRIELTATGARFVAQPGGAAPVAFELVAATANSATFANPQHDFPKRVRYARDGDALTARVDDGRDGGAAEEFRWTSCPG